MKTILRTALVVFLIGALSVGVAFGWYTVNNLIHKDYTVTVTTSEGMTFTEVSCMSNALDQVTGSTSVILGSDLQTTTDYYEAKYTVTAPGRQKFYVKSITWPTAALGQALRVQVTFNGSARLYAPDGATSGYTVSNNTVTFNTVGELIGVYTGTVDLTVRIFLEGNDAACTNTNIASAGTLNIGIDFEGVDF